MVTNFFWFFHFSEHYDVNDFFCKVFPRLFSISCFWTFINVQKPKPKKTFGNNSRVQELTDKREHELSSLP